MKTLFLPVLTSLALASSSIATLAMPLVSPETIQTVDWSYQGSTAPEHWSDLSPDNHLCTTGKNQSPINIDSKKTLYAPNRQQRGLKFNYGLIPSATISNTGHGIRIDIGSNNNRSANIKLDGVTFELKHLDIHMPSENTVNNKHFPMEIQFVHKSKDQQSAIVSLMYIPGKSDRTLRKLLKQLPQQPGESIALAANALKIFEVKKKVANYYRYDGSLTQPPCSEGTRWLIMKQPLTLSNEQQQQFKVVIKQDNNRPIQKINARKVME